MSAHDDEQRRLWKLAFEELPPSALREHCVACAVAHSTTPDVLRSLANVCLSQPGHDEAAPCTLLRCMLENTSLWTALATHFRARSSAAAATALDIMVQHCRTTHRDLIALQTLELDDYEQTLLRVLAGEADRLAAEAEAERLTAAAAAVVQAMQAVEAVAAAETQPSGGATNRT